MISSTAWPLLVVLQALVGTAASFKAASTAVSAQKSSWYDWGFYGVHPRVSYESFGASSPWTNVQKLDSRCAEGYIFIEPRGLAVTTPGPIILDQRGDLVWINTQWGQAMDLKVQSYKGEKYITFWTGSDNGTFGMGSYLMLNSSYDVVKTITPAGDFQGDLHEFLLTDDGTAMMTIYEKKSFDLSAFGIADGWIYDSLVQEIDMETGERLFEWRASEHVAMADTLAPIRAFGQSADHAFDFFHVNSITKDADKNYIVSSRYLCSLACIDRHSGRILWQLGGLGNNFTDLSDGAATNFTWQHHVTWHPGNILTVFDNGAYDSLKTAKHSRGLRIQLDMARMTATLLQSYVGPSQPLAQSQGSVQRLAADAGAAADASPNVMVGWGHVPAYTEFTQDGEVLCDVHLCPLHLDVFGWCKNYRTFKYVWAGQPRTPPDVAMRPREGALYASWNGATAVQRWVLQTSATRDGAFVDVKSVDRKRFETRIKVPAKKTRAFVRVAAVDRQGTVLAYSPAVNKHKQTAVAPMPAPPQHTLAALVEPVFAGVVGGVLLAIVGYSFRRWMARTAVRLWRRIPLSAHYRYQAVPEMITV